MSEEEKNALQLLKQYCNGNKDRLDFLEESITNGSIKIEYDGSISYSTEYILGDKELQFKTMPVEYIYTDFKVAVTNLINFNIDCKVEVDDVVVEKVSKFIVKNIIMSIKNNKSVEYWESLNN